MEVQLPEGLSYRDHPQGLRFIDIDHPACQASVCLQGAHITRFCPAGGSELLWISDAEPYLPGKALRGGIPICWPWFGAHPGQSTTFKAAPAHGVARTALWELVAVSRRVEGVALTLQLPAMPAHLVPAGVTLSLQIEMGEQLRLRLTTLNDSQQAFNFSQALHTYFDAKDIHQVRINGLAGAQYDDALLPEAERAQLALHDALTFAAEVDRIYYPRAPLQLVTPAQTVEISTEGSGSAVIWNPWVAKSQRLSHFKPDDYLRTLCIEAANCGRDSRTLAPGASHTLAVTYLPQATGKS